MNAIEKAQMLVTADPEILGGAPVFAGTRVPVDAVLASARKNIDSDRILKVYPCLTDEHLKAAEVYIGVHPRRGRPSNASTVPPSWKVKSSRRVDRAARKA